MCKEKKSGKKYFGVVFVSIALGFVLLVYSLYSKLEHCIFYLALLGQVWFHMVFGLFLFSFFRCSFSEPGIVPPYWGFQMGDSESKKKRYCLMCHVFKPDRCHHCSICNRCVLNMDHHCRMRYLAWINNCIGFFNRKIFMLMLFYSLLSGYTVLLSILPVVGMSLYKVWISESVAELHTSFILTTLLLVLIMITLTKFTHFHVQLVLKNSTTIESLENNYNPRYSISKYSNIIQVFGKNPILWPFPWYLKSGWPIGDGINWPMTGNVSLNSDVNIDSEPNIKEMSGKNVVIKSNEIWPAEKNENSKTPVESETDASFIRHNMSISN